MHWHKVGFEIRIQILFYASIQVATIGLELQGEAILVHVIQKDSLYMSFG